MEQFIQYLYEYEDGERIRNLGFMKVEHRMDKIEIQIYAKELDEVSGIRFKNSNGKHYIAAWEMAEAEVKEGSEGPEVGYIAPEIQSNAEVGDTTPEIQCETSQIETETEETYIPPSVRTCQKIQRQDLSRLPRKDWKVANNNFLLHGYYNYHHLLFIEDGDKMWLGVPGIYHEKEKLAAMSFGFPEFIRMTDFELELLPEEKNTMDDFGYWCRQVERL